MSQVNQTLDEEARQILDLLLSPSIGEDSKLAIIKGLLNKSKNENYSLGTIRQLLANSNFRDNDTQKRVVACSKMYGMFFEDNSFMIAMEKYHTESSWFRGPRENNVVALYDIFTKSQLGDRVEWFSHFGSAYEPCCPWRSEKSIEINGTQAYPVPIAKIIPARLFEDNTISIEKLKVICDTVNNYLVDNPLFTKEVFAKKRKPE